MASARATQDLTLNIKNLSPFLHFFLYYLHTLLRVSILWDPLQGDSQRLSVYGAKHNQRKLSERWGLKPTRTTNLLSANSSLQSPAVRSWTNSLRKSPPPWEQPCQYRGHFTTHGSQEPTTGPRAAKPTSRAKPQHWPCQLGAGSHHNQRLVQPRLQSCLLLQNLIGCKALTLCCWDRFSFLKPEN